MLPAPPRPVVKGVEALRGGNDSEEDGSRDGGPLAVGAGVRCEGARIVLPAPPRPVWRYDFGGMAVGWGSVTEYFLVETDIVKATGYGIVWCGVMW